MALWILGAIAYLLIGGFFVGLGAEKIGGRPLLIFSVCVFWPILVAATFGSMASDRINK